MNTYPSTGYLSALRRIAALAILALGLIAATSTSAFASHFRYATIDTQPVLDANGNPTGTMTFHVKTAWRRSFFGSLVVGNTFSYDTFYFGDGTSVTPTFTVTSYSATEDWIIGEVTLTHHYSGTATSQYTFYANNGARIANLNNGANANWYYDTTVSPYTTNNSPTTALPPIVTVQQGTAVQFYVPASDAERDRLTFRMSTNAGAGTTPTPPGFSINSATGLVTWNNIGLNTTNFWFAQVIIEDHDALGNVKSRVPVDFLLKISTSTAQPPTCLINGSSSSASISAAPGTPVSFTVTGSDPAGAVPVTLNGSGVPSAATLSPALPFTAASPISTTFNWTPTPADGGSHTITFTTTGGTGLTTNNFVTIYVETNQPPTITGPASVTTTYSQPAPIQVQVADPNGDALTVTWTVDGTLAHTDNVAATQNTTTLTYAPVFADTSAHTVVATVTDPKNASASLTTNVTVNKADQSIAFGAIADHQFDDAPFTISATASSGLPVGFTVSGPATVSGDTVTLTGLAGQVTITASQPGDADYNPALNVSQTFNVTAPDLNVTSITLETRQWNGHVPTSSADAVNTYVSLPLGRPGYAPAAKTLTIFDNVGNQATFGGVSTNIGYHHHFAFIAPKDGQLAIRMGVDFGGGGTLLIDGQLVQFRNTDMWWNFSYSNPAQYLSGTVTITAGPHTIDSYGFENCCDGTQQGQYSYLGQPYKTFTAPANTVPVVALSGPATADPNTTQTFTFTVADPDQGSSFTIVSADCGANGTLSGTPAIATGGGSFDCSFPNGGTSSIVSVQVADNLGAQSNVASAAVTINKLTQSITFAQPADTTYGAPDFTVSATASSNLPVTIAASGACTIGGTTVHVTQAGSCTLTASQAGNSTYAAAQDVTRTVNVAKANATVTVNGYTGVYDGSSHGATGTAKGVNGEDLTSLLTLGASFTDAPGGTAYWTFAGNGNYNSANGTATITITKANATVVVNGYTGVYDGNPHGATGSAKGINGEDLTSLLTLGASYTNAPGGTAHWTFAGNADYNAASGDVTIAINKANAAIVVNGYSGVYDGAAHGATGTATGVKGESLSSQLNLGASYTNAPGGTAHWTFTGGTNYNDASGDVTIAIARVKLTVTANNATKLLGAPLPAFTVGYAGFIPGEGPANLGGALTFTTPATASSPVGTYSVMPGGLLSPNYDISYVAGTLTITYNVCVQYDQTKVNQSGSTIPVKLEVCDASGANVSSGSTVVHATTVVQVSTATSGDVQDAGQANPDSDFRLVGPPAMYLFNLQTKGYATGTYQLFFVATGDPVPHSVSFQIK